MSKSKKAADKALVKLFPSFDYDLSEDFLVMFLRKVKIRHACVFNVTRKKARPQFKDELNYLNKFIRERQQSTLTECLEKVRNGSLLIKEDQSIKDARI